MADPTRITEFKRDPNCVFVSVQPPQPVQHVQQAAHYYQDWTAVASEIGEATPVETQPVPSEPIPTAEELLAAHLPNHIAESRWAIYITPSAKSRVFDGTTYVYNHPSAPFWNLYNLAKGIFRDLGISLSKTNGTWEARIPIKVLTDKVFVASGLAGVEKTLRNRKVADDDRSIASKISSEIRNRQFERTQRGISKVKAWREGLADAAGVMAITAVSWAFYVIGGAV